MPVFSFKPRHHFLLRICAKSAYSARAASEMVLGKFSGFCTRKIAPRFSPFAQCSFLKTKNLKLKTHAGFSLVELLVSLSLFTIVLTMAVGSLLVLIDANARAQNMQQVMTNLSFALDSISREVRTGNGLYCSSSDIDPDLEPTTTNDCTNGTYISVVEGGESLTGGESSSRVTFRYNGSGLSIERRVADGPWYAITSANVTITEMFFYVADSALSGDEAQANVTVYIAGYAGSLPTVDASFEVETTVTKRILDISPTGP